MPKVSINLVTLNGKEYLPFCLKSIFNQSFQDFSLLIIDNHSTDDTVEYLKENWPKVKVVAHKENRGFCQAHNEAIIWTNSDYVLILNQDVILGVNFLIECLKFLEENEKAGGAMGKLLRLDTNLSNNKIQVIDSTGLEIFKNHQIIDRGTGEKNRGQFNKIEEVFGISGACCMFKRKALEDAKISSVEYFDEDYFAYKEDVDLSWRLRLYGWKLFYLPQAKAYHKRVAFTEAGLPALPTKQTVIIRRQKPQIINFLSYKNHLLTIVKNEFLSNLILYAPFIFFYEFKKMIWILFFEPATLKAIFVFFQQLPSALKKRRIIMNKKKIKAKEIRKWYR